LKINEFSHKVQQQIRNESATTNLLLDNKKLRELPGMSRSKNKSRGKQNGSQTTRNPEERELFVLSSPRFNDFRDMTYRSKVMLRKEFFNREFLANLNKKRGFCWIRLNQVREFQRRILWVQSRRRDRERN